MDKQHTGGMAGADDQPGKDIGGAIGQNRQSGLPRFTFRYDRDLHGRGNRYLNVSPSKKALSKAREAIREKTGPSKCFKPSPEIVKDLNAFLRGWCAYFNFGYPRKAFRDLGHYARSRMITHLNRRSQRKYQRPKDMTHYRYLQQLGLLRP